MDLLLIAQSARMLAQSAARAGFRVFAIDFFADTDTLRHTRQCIAIAQGSNGFDEAKLLAAVEGFALPHGQSALVYGSGIDTRPELVERLTRERKLFGNSPATLRQINDPQVFFRLLTKLGIPFPETRFTPPDPLDGWLVKPDSEEGGKGVGFCANGQPPVNDAYYQRLAQGDAYSLLFLANGKEIRVIGFNTQCTAKHNPAQPFLFAGAVNRTDLSEGQRLAVEEYAAKLTAATGLVGLNSLDFMLAAGLPQVLEINPRPSATMALYDEDFPEGLLTLHITACQGELPPATRHSGPVRALRIVYSQSMARIPADFLWPKGCADIPCPGSIIDAGQPLCSLLVQTDNRQEAEILVELLENEILSGLDTLKKLNVGVASAAQCE